MASEGIYKGCRCHFEEDHLVLNRDCPVHGVAVRPHLYDDLAARAKRAARLTDRYAHEEEP